MHACKVDSSSCSCAIVYIKQLHQEKLKMSELKLCACMRATLVLPRMLFKFESES